MNRKERMEVFLDLLSCSHPLYFWQYDTDGHLLRSTCPSEELLDTLFRRMGCHALMMDAKEGSAPLILSGDARLVWIAAHEYDGEMPVQSDVLGPFFVGERHTEVLNELVCACAGESTQAWRNALCEALEELPTLSVPFYSQYAVMLHYLATGEKVPPSALRYLPEEQGGAGNFSHLKAQTAPKDRLEIYRAERALLNAVREGDIEGAAAMRRASDTARVRQYTDNPLRNAQIACTTFAAICTRAAIEGGLSTTLSYSLGDAYIKSIFLAKTLSEVTDIKDKMYLDFIHRVHACRKNPQYSKMVQGSCDYIELHLAESLNIDVLASRLGYSKYYLSTRFKKETGCSVNDYIKFARVERAKLLLSTTNTPIEKIAETAGFSSRNFFAATFKRCVGKTPAEYRKETLNT